jgi:CRISPR-associated protein Cas2
MFVIVVYDVNVKRTNKIMKICRKYLTHVQSSVFEGKITEAKLSKLKHEIKKCCNENEDSIMIYRFDSLRYSNKEVIGLHMVNDNII